MMSNDVYVPTVYPDPNFNARRDVETLKKAMEGAGTNEAALISVLCRRPAQQRYEIVKAYRELLGKDLEKEIDSETGGDFYKVLTRLLKSPAELAAYELNEAISGGGTDEECLVEVLCTKSSQELRAIEARYQDMYGVSLEKDVIGDTSGDFRRILVSLLKCNRPDDSMANMANATADAKALYEAGQNKVGTDETRFIDILTTRSYSQLRAIFACYSRDYKTDINDVIRSEFSADIRDALLAVVGAICNRPAYFAARLKTAMDGAGTDERMLLRIIVSRCDIDLGAIKSEFSRVYGKSLAETVMSETSGDYKDALIALLGEK